MLRVVRLGANNLNCREPTRQAHPQRGLSLNFSDTNSRDGTHNSSFDAQGRIVTAIHSDRRITRDYSVDLGRTAFGCSSCLSQLAQHPSEQPLA